MPSCKTLTAACALLAMTLAISISGCSDKNPTNPISQFSPEIINNPDAFEFQISDAENVTTTVNYSWENSGTGASIDQSCAITQGTAVITVFDSDDVQVAPEPGVVELPDVEDEPDERDVHRDRQADQRG